MRAYRLVVALVICCVAGVAVAGDIIPRSFAFADGTPLWISADDAITASGGLREDVSWLSRLHRDVLQWRERQTTNRAIASDSVPGCDIAFGGSLVDGPDEFTIETEALLREVIQSRQVASGKVTAIASGIHNGMPYSILAIATDTSSETASRVYLMYPRAKFVFQGVTICNEDPFVGPLPEIGDSILFIASFPIDGTGTLFSTPWVVHQGRRGVVKSSRLPIQRGPVEEFAARLRSAKQSAQQR